METWKIVLICYCALCYILVVPFSISAFIKRRKNGVKYFEFSEFLMDLFAPLAVIYGLIMIIFGDYFEKLKSVEGLDNKLVYVGKCLKIILDIYVN